MEKTMETIPPPTAQQIDGHPTGRVVRTVREATFDVFRAHGMTTIFGNPGSTELTMLADYPEDFTYVLGLQELVVVGMADGFAQGTGRPTHVNLHTAPGVGNAVGGICNAQANKAPLVITAGQQVRPQMLMEAKLTNRCATIGPMPYVKWSHEPARWFASHERVSGIPGLDLPGLDVAGVARGYGMDAREVGGREELTAALREAIADDDGPRLVQVPTASGMWEE